MKPARDLGTLNPPSTPLLISRPGFSETRRIFSTLSFSLSSCIIFAIHSLLYSGEKKRIHDYAWLDSRYGFAVMPRV